MVEHDLRPLKTWVCERMKDSYGGRVVPVQGKPLWTCVAIVRARTMREAERAGFGRRCVGDERARVQKRIEAGTQDVEAVS